jgi:hypothetical protein
VHKKPSEPTEQELPDFPTIVQPMVDELKQAHKTSIPDEIPPPVGPNHPPQAAELDQDPGGGYNPDGTFPQT